MFFWENIEWGGSSCEKKYEKTYVKQQRMKELVAHCILYFL